MAAITIPQPTPRRRKRLTAAGVEFDAGQLKQWRNGWLSVNSFLSFCATVKAKIDSSQCCRVLHRPNCVARVSHRLVPAAAMTQSTRRLRKRLTAAGIEFKMPLDPTGDQRDAQVRPTRSREKQFLYLVRHSRPSAPPAHGFSTLLEVWVGFVIRCTHFFYFMIGFSMLACALGG